MYQTSFKYFNFQLLKVFSLNHNSLNCKIYQMGLRSLHLQKTEASLAYI